MSRGRRVFVALALPAVAACAAAPSPGTSEPERPAIAAVHVSKCGSCHTRPDPRSRTREHLEDAFARHKRRVRLTSDEWAAMVDYLAVPEGKTRTHPITGG
jgi:hypothetical protein